MIYDKIDNLEIYAGISEDIRLGLEWLRDVNPEIEKGVYELSPRVKAIVSEYITKEVNENGYEDIDLYSYFGKDKTLFAKTVNKIMDDDNFYKQIARDMNIADGREKFYSSADIEAARLDLSCLLDRFKDRITSLKKG